MALTPKHTTWPAPRGSSATPATAGRRAFLRTASAAALAALWPPKPAGAEDAPRRVLVCLNLVGGLDGLSLLVPTGEDAYYRARPRLAVPPPGRRGGALPLTDRFGLHPKLEPLYQMYLEGTLAIVPAAGASFLGRSHFEARELLHTAAADGGNSARPDDGWANRYATARSDDGSEDVLFSTTRRLPLAFSGAAPVRSTGRFEFLRRQSEEAHLAALHRLYQGTPDAFARSAERALRAAAELEERAQKVSIRGDYGKLALGLRDAARLIQADAGAQLIWVEIEGFDTHKSQGIQLPMLLTELARGLASFRSDLGRRFADVALVTLTEFGRTLKETSASGTDHGSASCMLVLGGGVRGGRLVGSWPGLGPSTLHDGRDLAVTTDYRKVLGELLTSHLGLPPDDLAHVLPGFDLHAEPPLDLCVHGA